MPGAVHLLILFTLLVPLAAAGPTGSVAVGPGGLAGPDEPYYLRADVASPEAPRQGDAADDCAYDKRPAGPRDSAARVVGPVLSWDPRADPRLSTWFPECIAIAPGSSDGTPGPYASYDVTSGRYYAEAPGGATLPVGPGTGLGQQQQSATTVSGSTGVGLLADCEMCPPPDLG